MKKVFFIIVIICLGSKFSNGQFNKLDRQEKIKTSITLSNGEVLSVKDDLYFVKNPNRGDVFKYVFHQAMFDGEAIQAKYNSVFSKQRIYYFKKLNDVYFAYTKNYVVAIEAALKEKEITCSAIRSLDFKQDISLADEIVFYKDPSKVMKIKVPVEKSRIGNSKLIGYPLRSLTMLDAEPIDIEKLENDKSVLEMHHMRYCLRMYHKNRRLARDLMFGGMACGVVGGVFYKDDFGKGLMCAGGGLGVASFVMYIVAEKWLKYSSIKPVLNGDQVGIMINF